jgi:endonuclease YncB( thermonuclease family)
VAVINHNLQWLRGDLSLRCGEEAEEKLAVAEVTVSADEVSSLPQDSYGAIVGACEIADFG